jgi:hypothetical protein
VASTTSSIDLDALRSGLSRHDHREKNRQDHEPTALDGADCSEAHCRKKHLASRFVIGGSC